MYLFGIGLGVFIGALYAVYYRDAHFWRLLAQPYGRPWKAAPHKKRFQHAVAYGKGFGSKSYNGLLTIGLHDDGLAMRVMAPFSFFHDPVFIPYKDIRGWEQTWYLNAKTLELEFEQAPDIKLVMPVKQVAWMRAASQNTIEIFNSASPHNAKPTLWYCIILFQGVLAILLAVYLMSTGYRLF